MNTVTTTIWQDLPLETRNSLRQIFQVRRSGCVEVEDGERVICDGTTGYDLLAITADKMVDFIGGDFEDVDSETRFQFLWDATLAKIEGKEEAIFVEPKYDDTEPKTLKPAFCDSCDSKGVRHKKACPKSVK